MSELGFPRFEHLSAAAFQTGPLPNLEDAIRLGRSERLAMALVRGFRRFRYRRESLRGLLFDAIRG
jgi:hypothetical protein